MPTLSPQQFVKKWSQIQLKERSTAQSHFNDICALVGHKTPLEIDPNGQFFTFEAQAHNCAKLKVGSVIHLLLPSKPSLSPGHRAKNP